ncbi:Dynein regulatory complex subunit 6 [Sparganum proliferum]
MRPNHPLLRGPLFEHPENRLRRIKLAEFGLISASEKRRLATSFFEMNRKRIFTGAWQKFVCIRFSERERKMELIGILLERLQSRAKSKVFTAWHDFVQHKVSAREVAIALIVNARNQLVVRKALTTWRQCALGDNDMWTSLQIFSYLTPIEFARCSLVCRSWKVAVDTNAASGHLDLSKFSHRIQDWLLWKLARMGNVRLRHINLLGCNLLTPDGFYSLSKCKNVQDVCLSKCAGVTDSVVSRLICQWPMLLKLDLSFTPITDAALNQIARHACNLSNLSLAHCLLITDVGTSFFLNAPASVHLHSLNLTGCSGLTENGLVSLVRALPQLRRWTLGDTSLFNEGVLQEMGKSEVLEAVTLSLRKPAEPKSPKLTQSRKSTLCKADEMERSAAAIASHTTGIAALLRPSLRTLRLHGLDSLLDEAFNSIVQAAKPVLNFATYAIPLNSNRSTLISGAKIPTFVSSTYALSNLAVKDCPQITDKLLEKIAYLSRLTCLNLSRCGTLTDTAMKIISESAFIGKLAELYLSHCSQITDFGVCNIPKRARNLVYLGVNGCTKLSDISLSTLRLCPKLTWINFAGTQCSDATATTVASLQFLSSVNFSDCLKLSDSSLRKLISTSDRFEVINLSRCQNIKDAGVQALITGSSIAAIGASCSRLCELDVSGCPQILASSFKALQKGCPNLRYLGIRNCPGITRAMVESLSSWVQTVDYRAKRVKR